MDLDFQTPLLAPLSAVEPCLLMPALVGLLAQNSTVLASAELRSRLDDGNLVTREAFYVLRNDVFSTFSLRLLPRIAWTERVVWNRSTHAGTFVILPEVPAPLTQRVTCDGTYLLLPNEPSIGLTTRKVLGHLTIDAPFVGRRAEGLMFGVLKTFFQEEAALLERLAKNR